MTKFEQKTFSVSMAALEEAVAARRWRAAFGEEGGCERCRGTGKLYSGPGLDFTDEYRDCCNCLGTGRGEHKR